MTKRGYSCLTDPKMKLDRAEGGSDDPRANYHTRRLHKHLEHYSKAELIDLAWHLLKPDESDKRKLTQIMDDELEHIILHRYFNRHPKEFDQPDGDFSNLDILDMAACIDDDYTSKDVQDRFGISHDAALEVIIQRNNCKKTGSDATTEYWKENDRVFSKRQKPDSEWFKQVEKLTDKA